MTRNEKTATTPRAFALLFLILTGFGAGSTESTLAQDRRFQKLGVNLDAWAESQIGFWRRVYTEFNQGDYLVHDSINLAHLYRVEKSAALAGAARRSLSSQLSLVAKGKGPVLRDGLKASEIPLFEAMEANEDRRAYGFASSLSRIRIQTGLKDRLGGAFIAAKPYLKRMRQILEEEGVPGELVWIPFVESAFNEEARSKTGAVGIWQFMSATAMRDLRVTRSIDERYDPLKSTRAAARFLRKNFNGLGNWGLAVMAYHHGPGLVKKAVKSAGSSDPVRVLRTFKDPNFQFASRNYLFEVLAMCDAASDPASLPGGSLDGVLPEFITVSFPVKTKVKDLLQRYRLKEMDTRLLNPHFRSAIWTNEDPIPAHYPVRLAGITLEEFRRLEYPQ